MSSLLETMYFIVFLFFILCLSLGTLLASERSERDTIRGNSIEISLYLASERSERDTYRGNTIENRGCLFICLYICLDVRMSFCTLTLAFLC